MHSHDQELHLFYRNSLQIFQCIFFFAIKIKPLTFMFWEILPSFKEQCHFGHFSSLISDWLFKISVFLCAFIDFAHLCVGYTNAPQFIYSFVLCLVQYNINAAIFCSILAKTKKEMEKRKYPRAVNKCTSSAKSKRTTRPIKAAFVKDLNCLCAGVLNLCD